MYVCVRKSIALQVEKCDYVMYGLVQDSRVQWPSSLTSDVVHKKIYWTDTHTDSIGTSDYNGNQRKILLHYALSTPLGLGLFEDYLYVSNVATDTMTKVSKFDGRARTIFHRGNVKSDVIKIVHRIMQSSGEFVMQLRRHST